MLFRSNITFRKLKFVKYIKKLRIRTEKSYYKAKIRLLMTLFLQYLENFECYKIHLGRARLILKKEDWIFILLGIRRGNKERCSAKSLYRNSETGSDVSFLKKIFFFEIIIKGSPQGYSPKEHNHQCCQVSMFSYCFQSYKKVIPSHGSWHQSVLQLQCTEINLSIKSIGQSHTFSPILEQIR